MPRGGCEDGGLATIRRPLDVTPQVGDDRRGAGPPQHRRLGIRTHKGPDDVPALEQQGHDSAPEPPMGTGDEHNHEPSSASKP